MNFTVVANSETPVVSLQEAKTYCRIDNDSEDALLSALIGAAQTHVENFTGRVSTAKQLDCYYNAWLDTWSQGEALNSLTVEQAQILSGFRNQIVLPFSTATAVAVYYFDSSGVEQTVSSSLYTLQDINSVSTIVFKSSFTYPLVDSNKPLPIRVRATYASDAKVSNAVKILVLSLVSYWYTQREPVAVGTIATKLPLTFEALAWTIRRGDFLP